MWGWCADPVSNSSTRGQWHSTSSAWWQTRAGFGSVLNFSNLELPSRALLWGLRCEHSSAPCVFIPSLGARPCQLFAALGSFFPRDVEHRASTGSKKKKKKKSPLITEDRTSTHDIVLQVIISVLMTLLLKNVSWLSVKVVFVIPLIKAVFSVFFHIEIEGLNNELGNLCLGFPEKEAGSTCRQMFSYLQNDFKWALPSLLASHQLLFSSTSGQAG